MSGWYVLRQNVGSGDKEKTVTCRFLLFSEELLRHAAGQVQAWSQEMWGQPYNLHLNKTPGILLQVIPDSSLRERALLTVPWLDIQIASIVTQRN